MSDLMMCPKILCSSTTSSSLPSSVWMIGRTSWFLSVLKIIVFVFIGFNSIFLSSLYLFTASTSICNGFASRGRICPVLDLNGTGRGFSELVLVINSFFQIYSCQNCKVVHPFLFVFFYSFSPVEWLCDGFTYWYFICFRSSSVNHEEKYPHSKRQALTPSPKDVTFFTHFSFISDC